MSAPAFLLGAALLFWGQQAGLWFLAVPMALILEGARLADRRWELSREDFIRVGDLSTLLFASIVLYLYLTRDMVKAFAAILAWLPVACFPLIAAQCLSAEGRLDLGALFWSLRRRAPAPESRSVDVSYPYFALCILSAGTANVRTPVYYFGTCALGSWALWRVRPPSRPLSVWAALLAAAGVLGYAGSASLTGLQVSIEKAAEQAMFGGNEFRIDPYQSRTAMGQIGKLQQSGEIVLRVKAEHKPPALLRAASYNRYKNAQWFARDSGFEAIPATGDGTDWELARNPSGSDSILVLATWPYGEGVLAVPTDAFRIEDLPAAAMQRNRLGTIEASEAPAAVAYRVRFGPGAARDVAPDAADLEIPAQDAAMFTALSRELGLERLPPRRALDLVVSFFAKNFRYSIYQEKSSPAPLRDFLLKIRAGHCEYFATAAVLLLRAGGIPARYAAGYSVQEYSQLEKAYVLRQRHAHAWTLAYVDGAWRDVDTTPASWFQIERSRASSLEALSDLASWARLRLSLWRENAARAGRRGPAAWILLTALAVWMIWKASALRKASRRDVDRTGTAPAVNGADSEFFLIESQLGRSGLGRRPWEASADWLARIESAAGASKAAPLWPMLTLHYRHRFDPQGLREEERRELRLAAESWLRENGGMR